MPEKNKEKSVSETVELDNGITATKENGEIVVKGPKGEDKKKLLNPLIDIKINEDKITLSSKIATKKTKKMINTFKAHLKNMVKGTKEGFTYKLKVCSGHFPMNISVDKEKLVVKNFLGEKTPRTLKLKEGVNVKIEGDIVIVESIDKETAGQVAADIEQLTRRPGFDTRIFQDGIYITEKSGKQLK